MKSKLSEFPAEQSGTTKVDYPGTALSLAATLTVVAVCYLALLVYNIPKSMNELREKQQELILLRGEILRLDEVLTMSARMAVATGDEQWIERYNYNEPLLEKLLKETEALVQDDVQTTQATLQTDEANRRLVEMERQALQAVQSGEIERARAVLGQSAYDEQKVIYLEGMINFLEQIDARFDKSLRQKQSWATLGLISALGFFILLGLMWHRTLNLLMRWRNALLATQTLLADAYNLMAMSLNSVGMGTWSYSLNTNELDFSPIAAKALALPDNSEIGLKEILRRIEPDSRPLLYDAIRQARKDGPAEVEIAMHGQEFAQRQWIQVVLEVSEHASTLSGTLSNITQRHHKFSQLKSQKAQLEKGIASHLKTVREQAHQLQGLAIQVNEVEHRERQRIAMVLHDSLQQDLVGLRFQLASLDNNLPSNAKPQMKVLSDSIDDCIQRVRTMSIDLNPSVLKESGFIAAIEWIRDSMSERFGLTVQLESTLSYERLESAEIEALAFQCVRELLFNVVKHAETKQVEIELNEMAAGDLFISVRDKGIGFELGGYFTGSENYRHFGLRNITSRIRAIGGTIDIVTKPGEGTSVNFTLPTVREKVSALATKAVP